METAFIIWYCVVIMVCAIILARIVVAISQHHFRRHNKKAIHIVQMSNEREMLYIPGDSLNMDGSDNDYNTDDM